MPESLARRRERYATEPEYREKLKARAAKRHREKRVEILAKLRADYRDDPAKRIVKEARGRAKKLGLPFDLTPSDIEVPSVCPVLGMPLRISDTNSHGENSPSLDRVIPELGYVKGNVRVISWRANRIKNDGTLAEHEAVAAYIRHHLSQS